MDVEEDLEELVRGTPAGPNCRHGQDGKSDSEINRQRRLQKASAAVGRSNPST
jgi:hypothetical protein